AAGEVVQIVAQAVDFSTLGADDQAWAGGLDDDLEFFAGALDVNIAHRSKRRLAVEAVIHKLADFLVFDQQLAVERLGGIPAALVSFGNPDAEPEWMDFLYHDLNLTLQRRWPRS